MPQISHTITINRPVNEVFRTATDFSNAQEWQPDVVESTLSGEKPRVGLFITQSRDTHALGWRLDLNADITGYTPNRLLEYKGVVGRFPVSGRIEFEHSGTVTTVRETLDVRTGCLYAAVNPFLAGALNKRTQRALDGLKQKLENTSSGAASPTDFHENL